MELKPLPNLLEEKHEYTYEEAFHIYDKAGKEACEEENRAIKEKNTATKIEIDAVNIKNKKVADNKNTQAEEKARKKNSEENITRWMKIAGISFVIAVVLGSAAGNAGVFFIVLLIAFAILVGVIDQKYHSSNKEKAKVDTFDEIPTKNYTFLPSGIIQCSSCGTKTKIDNKDSSSTCPNCHSEIFIISKIDNNVTIKTMAQSE